MTESSNLKIGACIMVHNMAPFIGACVASLQWTDGIFIYDDHSTDNSIKIGQNHARVPFMFEKSGDKDVAFRRGELAVRNYVIDRAFQLLRTDALIIVDADEMFSSATRAKIVASLSDRRIDSVAFSTWHLYDEKRYLHFWETKINGVHVIDPHTRVIKRGKGFAPLFANRSHPIIEATGHTSCFHGPHHFHLKYHHRSKLPNYSLFFLPERLTEFTVAPYLRPLPLELPDDIASAMAIIDWDAVPRYAETPHYPSERVTFSDPKEALTHPKDKQQLEKS